MASERSSGDPRAVPVASTRHFVIFLAIVAVVTWAGFAAQNRQAAGGGVMEGRPHVIPIYLSLAALDWLLLYFAWQGIRRRGGTFRSLIQGRWATPREELRDLGIAAAFWGVLMGTAWGLDHLFPRVQTNSLDILLPKSVAEVSVWILTSVSAGFCEEFVFRGYVQRQLLAWSNSASIAVLGQALLFGMMHSYQGWAPALRIVGLGVLFGALAAWRKTLRAGMVAHAWQDVWAGWLSRVTFG
jgi:membrane protease YdiL (CAAX protease family)